MFCSAKIKATENGAFLYGRCERKVLEVCMQSPAWNFLPRTTDKRTTSRTHTTVYIDLPVTFMNQKRVRRRALRSGHDHGYSRISPCRKRQSFRHVPSLSTSPLMRTFPLPFHARVAARWSSHSSVAGDERGNVMARDGLHIRFKSSTLSLSLQIPGPLQNVAT